MTLMTFIMTVLTRHIGYLLVLQLILVTSIPHIEITLTVIEEYFTPSTVIRNLMDEPIMKTQFSPDEMKEIYFQYLSAPPVEFSVDSYGALRTTTLVDRDKICPNMIICTIELDLAVQPVQHFMLIKVIITIQDVNDHNPIFTQPQMTHILSESTRVGTSFVLPEVTDPDSPKNSVQRVYLRPDRSEFELRVNRKPDGSQDIRVVLREVLDRESISEYHMEVVALDGGDPPKSGTMQLTITVADANDNNPTFDKETYDVIIPENVPVGYFLTDVYAKDLDIGLNSRIVYRWSDDTATSFGHIFSINNVTGEIIVIGKIDYEAAAIMHLTVEARDQGADPIPAETVVIVHIEDVNDHAPEILVHTLGGPGVHEVSVLEGAAAGTFVARVVVKDQDSGDNGRYNCSIHEDNFLLDPLGADFLITTRGELDREQQAEYDLAISCRDFGRQPQTTVTYILVKIQDVNDNSPQFSEKSYFVQIYENNIRGSPLIQVTANDLDEGNNAEIQYTIQGPELQWFNIDPNSGVIRSTVSLNREVQVVYDISIIATDLGDPSHSAITTLTVDVLDVNDERPIFTEKAYIFRIFENQEPGMEIGIVRAEDADSLEFSHHTYSLQNEMNGLFRIGMSTGRISTTESLDREKQKVYTVIAVAMDTSEPYFSSSATVSVYVMDRNDNPPRFTFPTPHNNTVYVSNSIPVGYIITKVHANDKDGESAGQVRYEMVQSSDQPDFFEIEPYLGTISLASSVHHIENASLTLTIIASDNGDVSMSTSATLYIVIDNTIPVPVIKPRTTLIHNVIIVIIVGCVSGVLVVVLIMAIFVICHKRRYSEYRQQCQTEELKVLPNATPNSYTRSVHKHSVVNDAVDDNSLDSKPNMTLTKNPGDGDCVPDSIVSAPMNSCRDKSRQWLEHMTSFQDNHDANKKDPDTESLNSGLGSNTDSGRGPSEQGEIKPAVEYGFIQGYHKDPKTGLLSPSGPERSLPGTSFHIDLKSFTGESSTDRGVYGNPSRTHYVGGYQTRSYPRQPRSITPQPTIEEYEVPNEDMQILETSTANSRLLPINNARLLAQSKVKFGSSNITHPHQTNFVMAASKNRPQHYTSAHGYHGDTTNSKQSYHFEDEGTITHVVDGVKVTDIIV